MVLKGNKEAAGERPQGEQVTAGGTRTAGEQGPQGEQGVAGSNALIDTTLITTLINNQIENINSANNDFHVLDEHGVIFNNLLWQ